MRVAAGQNRERSPRIVGMKPPIVILAYYYPPDPQSAAARPHRLAKYLERLGHPVWVLSAGNRKEPQVEGNVHRLRGGAVRNMKQDFACYVERLLRRTAFVHDQGGTWIPRTVSYVRRWIGEGPKPVIFSTAPPAPTNVAGLCMKKRYGIRWIADFQDPMTSNLFRPGRMSALFDPIMERLIFRNADIVIANTDTTADLQRRRYPQEAHKVHVVWNGFDPEEALTPMPIPLRDHRVMAHVGAIYGVRSPDLLLESIKRLLAQGELKAGELRVRLVGMMTEPARESPVLKELVARGCLELNAGVPRKEAQRIMATSDYLLLLDVTTDRIGLQVPAKLFEYVRVGRPVLACTVRNSPVDRILSRSGIRYTGLYSDAPAGETDRRLVEFLRIATAPMEPSQWFREAFDARAQAEYVSALATSLATRGFA